MNKISIDNTVLPFNPNAAVKTLRETLLGMGVSIEGITSDSGFVMNGNNYDVILEKDPRLELYYSVHTTERDINNQSAVLKGGSITVFNTQTADDIHRLMFSALLQYDPSQFYGQINRIAAKKPLPQEQQSVVSVPYAA